MSGMESPDVWLTTGAEEGTVQLTAVLAATVYLGHAMKISSSCISREHDFFTTAARQACLAIGCQGVVAVAGSIQ